MKKTSPTQSSPEAVPVSNTPLVDDELVMPENMSAKLIHDQEWALLVEMRKMGRGTIESIDIKDGLPVAFKFVKQNVHLDSASDRAAILKGQFVSADLAPDIS